MKLNTIAGFVLLSLAPALSHAGAVNWTSQEYNIYAYLDIDTPKQPVLSPQLDITKSSLADLPDISTASLTSDNGVARADLGIKNLSNSTHDIVELSLNAFSSYKGGTSASTQYSYVVPSVSLDNTFLADLDVLTVTYDYSALIKLTTPTAGQNTTNGMSISLELEDVVSGVSQYLDFVDNFELNASADRLFASSGVATFNVTHGRTYRILADISPDLFTPGSVTENSSNSVLKLGFSNVAVAAVPEPETYAMLLAGLVLVGFSARRQTQA